MGAAERFDSSLDRLGEGLGRADRHAGLRGCCTGPMPPLSRKSAEPMAARMDSLHASARQVQRRWPATRVSGSALAAAGQAKNHPMTQQDEKTSRRVWLMQPLPAWASARSSWLSL